MRILKTHVIINVDEKKVVCFANIEASVWQEIDTKCSSCLLLLLGLL